MPKYTSGHLGPMPTGDLSYVGSDYGPMSVPDQMIVITPDQVGYIDLFASTDPSGKPKRYMNHGSYPVTTGAMRRH